MSIRRTVNIACPTCSIPQDVQLYDAINVQNEPRLREELMQNRLNRVDCIECAASFRVDLPLLYSDPRQGILISSDTQLLVHRDIVTEQAEPITVKGFEKPVPIYRVLGVKR